MTTLRSAVSIAEIGGAIAHLDYMDGRAMLILGANPAVVRLLDDNDNDRYPQLTLRYSDDDVPGSGWAVVRVGRAAECDCCLNRIGSANGGYGYGCDDCGERLCDDCGPCDCDTDDSCDCEDCREYRGDSSGGPQVIRSYNYQPRWRAKGEYGTSMGVELEVGGSRSAITRVVQGIDPNAGHLIMKNDGSISGVEIVTHPMTLDYAKGYPFPRLLDEITTMCDGYVTDGYGLHIHVSRAAFNRPQAQRSAPHQMRWLLFMYRNVADLEKLARRSRSEWAHFRRPGRGELARKARGPLADDRYVAVNCNNSATYELRFFRSTLIAEQFYAAIEFADASVEYTRNLKTSDILSASKALSWNHFRSWLAEHEETYPNLRAEIG
jgi:hypothetical protein